MRTTSVFKSRSSVFPRVDLHFYCMFSFLSHLSKAQVPSHWIPVGQHNRPKSPVKNGAFIRDSTKTTEAMSCSNSRDNRLNKKKGCPHNGDYTRGKRKHTIYQTESLSRSFKDALTRSRSMSVFLHVRWQGSSLDNAPALKKNRQHLQLKRKIAEQRGHERTIFNGKRDHSV